MKAMIIRARNQQKSALAYSLRLMDLKTKITFGSSIKSEKRTGQ